VRQTRVLLEGMWPVGAKPSRKPPKKTKQQLLQEKKKRALASGTSSSSSSSSANDSGLRGDDNHPVHGANLAAKLRTNSHLALWHDPSSTSLTPSEP